jgi:hypothetical protein
MKKRIMAILVGLFMVGALIVGCAGTQTAPVQKVAVTFINNNPDVTKLGLAKFILDENGNKIDYFIAQKGWGEREKTLLLDPGIYGVTQWCPVVDAIVGYQDFEVTNKPLVIMFKKL